MWEVFTYSSEADPKLSVSSLQHPKSHRQPSSPLHRPLQLCSAIFWLTLAPKTTFSSQLLVSLSIKACVIFFFKSSVESVQIPANAKLENDTGWLKKPYPALCFSVCPFCLHHRPDNKCPHKKKQICSESFWPESRQEEWKYQRKHRATATIKRHEWKHPRAQQACGGELPKKRRSELPRTPLWFWTQNSLAQHCWQCLRCEATSKQQLSALKLNYFPDIFRIKSFSGIHVSLCLMS